MTRAPRYYGPLRDVHQQSTPEGQAKDTEQEKQAATPELEAGDGPTRPTDHPGAGAAWTGDPRMDAQQKSAVAMDRRVNARFAEHNAEIALQRSGSGEPAAEPGNVKAEEHETTATGGEMTDAQRARLDRLLGDMVRTPEHEHDQGLDMGRERGDQDGDD